MSHQRDWAKVPIEKYRPPYVEKSDGWFGVVSAKREHSHHRAAADFPVGTRVRIVCRTQDFMYFGNGDEPGVVIANKNHYLGIIVKFDEPHVFHSDAPCTRKRCNMVGHRGRVMEDFNFEPSDLIIEGEKK